eukprot:TRINITY_DN55229_c0_g1_i1.p1 TRINITY_DN55229_c0_g1~~TRINITY_DN55229_c0_g1_i1.p1  ORF type:complete len:448 (+),score=121.59 TRINITY_DN55229_c0_g1_i1:78-1421(+)
MQVSVLSCSGLPPNSQISLGVRTRRVVRAGDSGVGKACHFAEEDVEEPGVIKVDVLTMAGSERVVRQPGARTYSVSVPNIINGCEGQPMQLELGVSAADGAASKTRSQNAAVDEKKLEGNRAECQKYLEEHKLTDYLQAMVKSLLDTKPKDPYAWMAAQLASTAASGNGVPAAPAATQASAPPAAPATADDDLPTGQGPSAIVRTERSRPSGGACVVTGPSGVGKSTLIKKLMAEFPNGFGFSVSHTTRAPRPGEQNGIDYHFVSREEIERDIKAGLFIEHAEVHGNYYGTSIAAVESVMRLGKICLLDIDVQGADSVRKSSLADKTTFAFFAPPSAAVLEKRLRGRGTETEEKVQKRLEGAKREMAVYNANPECWDLTLKWHNEDVDAAYVELRSFLQPQMAQTAPAAAAAADSTAPLPPAKATAYAVPYHNFLGHSLPVRGMLFI